MIFEKAFAPAEIANLTEEDWSLYQRAMKYEWDEYARYTTAEQKGIAKGKVEGKMEGKIEDKMEGRMEVAPALLQEGSDPALVAKVTGLTADQIRQLQKPAATIRKLYTTKE